MDYFIGLDIGGTKCAVLLAKAEDGIEIIDKISFPTESEKGFAHTKDRLFDSVHRLLQGHSETGKLRGMGISCGGPLDSKKGLILSPPNLPGWDEIPLVELLRKEFHVPAFLKNDANACALVEWKLGAGQGTENMIFLTMGTGIGAGIIAGGALLDGHSDLCGECGHMRLAPDGPIGFGKAGSFEGFCSGAGIGRQAQAATLQWIAEGQAPRWTADGIPPEQISAKVIADYAAQGDPQAAELFSRVGEKLGEALSILIDTLNPERIVIGSVFARSGQYMRTAMENAMKREALEPARRVCSVVPAHFDRELGDLASIMVVCHQMGVEVQPLKPEVSPAVLLQYNRLFTRYPETTPLRAPVMKAYQLLERCFRGGGKLLVCGNGGSCSDAEHIVGELMKGFYKKRPLQADAAASIDAQLPGGSAGLQGALPAIALTGHNALSTAFSNDVDASMVFAQQVFGYGVKGDVLIAITTSGSSKNVVKAAKVAKAKGMKVIALTGSAQGEICGVSDVIIGVPGDCVADIQELHLPVYHTLCAMLEEKFFS